MKNVYKIMKLEKMGYVICKKCHIKDYEDNPLCSNKFYGCVETLSENCLRCDDLYDLDLCTECAEGYILNDDNKCVKL